MNNLLGIAVRAIRTVQNVEALVVTSSSEVVYRIPRGDTKVAFPEVTIDNDYITIRTMKIDKIVPVSESPLDPYRGRGKLIE